MPKARPRRLPPHRGPRPKGRRPQRQQQQAPAPEPVPAPAQAASNGHAPVTLPKSMLVGDLAKFLEVPVVDVMRTLVGMGEMKTINQSIDFETAALVATELGIEPAAEEEAPAPTDATETEVVPVKLDLSTDDDTTRLKTRPTVVTILAHVDHGT